jgi:hypothetical protein
MTRLNDSPLDFNHRDATFSGLQRIRLAYSGNIIQQKWASETEIVTPVLFDTEDNLEHWICDWSKGDFTNAEFGISEQVTDNGTAELYSLKVIFETGITQVAFLKWFNKSLKQQQVCVVVLDNNCNERAFNPFEVNYKYISSGSEAEMNRYELTFARSRLLDIFTDDYILGTVQTAGVNEALFVKVNFLSNKPQHYLIGLSKINNIQGVETWISGEIAFQNIATGDYFLFAKHKNEESDIVLSTIVIVDFHVDFLSFKGWEEIFASELTFTSWEEITDYAVSETDLVIGINV